MQTKLTILLSILLLAAAGCDKDKRASKRLMNAGTWKVKTLTVDGQAQDIENMTWVVSECDIYEDLCIAQWKIDTKSSLFYWQFNEKAQTFTVSRVVAPEDCEDFYTEEVEQLTYLLSGEYKVIETKRKTKRFESSATIGHPNKTVVIEVERF
jgi:hypothetical protein